MNQAKESGLISRIEEYFSLCSRFDYVDARTYIQAIENTLPNYLELFQRYANPLDWKLLATIALSGIALGCQCHFADRRSRYYDVDQRNRSTNAIEDRNNQTSVRRIRFLVITDKNAGNHSERG